MVSPTKIYPPREPKPAWWIARLFPNQGQWSEGDFLALNRLTNNFAELADGTVEVLQMPTRSHQRIVVRLLDLIREFVEPRKLGEVIVAPFPVRLRAEKYREPDIVF